MSLPRSPVLAFPALVVFGSAALAQAVTTRVSVSSSGEQANGHSEGASISDDGRFVVFDSGASNLVPNDSNGASDIFLHDMATGTTVRLSEGPGGVQGDAGSSRPLISGSGRFVTFGTLATNLVVGVSSAGVVCVDLETGARELVSYLPGGAPAPGGCAAQAVSSTGRFVSFTADGGHDGYVRDRSTGVTTLVWGGPQVIVNCASIRVSDDGRFVALATLSSSAQVRLLDRQSGASWTFSVPPSSGGGSCSDPALSRDGRLLAFVASGSVLPYDNHPGEDLYLFDRVATSLSIVTPAGLPSGHNGTYVRHPSFSGDRSSICFASDATDMVPGTSGAGVVLQRLDTGAREIVSLTTGGLACGTGFELPATSATGRYVAFQSTCSTLVPGDTNGPYYDIFVRDRWYPSPASYCEAKVNSQGCTPSIGSTGSPSLGGADDFHVTASTVRNQSSGLLYWGTAPDFVPFAGGTRCVRAPVIRTPIRNSGGATTPSCTGTYDFHFSHAYMATYLLAPGTTLYAQWWQRDPGHPDGTGQGLTNGLEFTVTP